jgi:hypothetical protein
MKEISNPSRENYRAVLPEECLPVLHYMRPQFRFLIYIGRDDTRVNLEDELVRFFDDAEKVVSGDASVWGSPVVVDGVLLLPDVECLVPSWLRQEFLERTSDLGVPEGQHYVYPGVRGPLLLPSDYIREYYFSLIYIWLVYLISILRLCLCLRLGFYVTAVAPALSDQRAAALRQGGHVLSRRFRYYVPDFSGRTVVQTPLTVR